MAVCYEIWRLWLYFMVAREGHFWGYHPWYATFTVAIFIVGLIYLYPLAKQYDEMGKM